MRLRPGFLLREASKNIRLNLLMSTTAVTTTFVCLLVLGIGLLVSAHVQGLVSSIRQDVAITAFFPPSADTEEASGVVSKVEGWSEVSAVDYVSKERALERFKERYRDRPEIYENLGTDVLPASLEIRLNNPGSARVVAGKLENIGFAEEDLSYPQRTIERLNEVTEYMVWGLQGATALFLVSSVLLISNTIRLSIFARRKEIEVMKLVGASDGFVRTPFVLEGMGEGLVGAALAALAVLWLNVLFVDWSREALPFVPISEDAVDTLFVLLVLMGVGAGIGMLGSFLSVRRFLRA